MNIFLGLIGVHEFFFILIFPCTNIFFVLCLPPHKFSNGPSLSHFSFFFALKSGFIRLNHCRKGKAGTPPYLCKISMEKKKLEGDYSNLEWKKLGERTLVAQNTACRKLHKTTKSHEQCRKLLGMGMYRPNTYWKHWTKVLFVCKKVHSVIQFDKMLPKYIFNVFLI